MNTPIPGFHQRERQKRWAKRARLGVRLTASILSIIYFCLDSGHRALAQPVDLRTVTMRVVPDESYQAQPSWEPALRDTVKAVSDIYEKNFKIRFVILDIFSQTFGERVPRRGMLGLVRGVPIGDADVLVGFSYQRCERHQRGQAEPFGRTAVVLTGCAEGTFLKQSTPERTLAHELAHLFGAFHPARGVDSLMRPLGALEQFDEQTIRVINLMRNYDFQRGIMGLNRNTRRAWSSVYAEGHALDEANPLAMALGNAGWDLLRSGKIGEAETALNEAIAIDPSHAGSHTALGFLYSRRGLLEDAARELRAAEALDFHEIEARTELGFVLLRLGKDEEALWEFREVLRVDPRLARPHVGLGMTLVRRDKVDEAITEYSEAIRLDPKDATALDNRAHAYARKGELDRAILDYGGVIRLNPSYAPAFNSRGAAYRRKGEYDRAVQDFDQAVRLQPTFAIAWNNRCFTRAVTGRLEAALADCNESLRLRPDSGPTLDRRGLTYLKLGQLDWAIADYDAALRLDPKQAHALYGRGLAKRKKGDLSGGEADLAAARAISPRIAEEYAGYGVSP
jgi:tetratricopeptide (TPR) repeat protein